MTVAVLVPAAGRGARLGGGTPKALRLLGGEPLLVHAVRRLRAARLVSEVVVAAPVSEVAAVQALLGGDARVVAGGATRQESVALALDVLGPEVDVVLVHDAARPLVPPALVDAVAAAVIGGAAAVVPVIAVADTIKRVSPSGDVVETVPRHDLRAVQTPQGFRRDVLERAHASGRLLAGGDATDDAGLVEAIGVTVTTVEGSPVAMKVTTTFDLDLAESLLARAGASDALAGRAGEGDR